MIINQFKGRYGFLSNFAPSPIVVRGQTFPTVEHAFQAWKMTNAEQAELVRCTSTPALAKKLARSLPCRADWQEIKVGVMHECCAIKFAEDPFRKLLLDTGEATLIEGNSWGDTFWGVCRGAGKNHLGVILMCIRSDLRTQ